MRINIKSNGPSTNQLLVVSSFFRFLTSYHNEKWLRGEPLTETPALPENIALRLLAKFSTRFFVISTTTIFY